MEYAVGVDACPSGWIVTEISDTGIDTALFQTFDEIYREHTAPRILVDIPIGLPQKSRRRCDEKAKELLGCRGNSVFFPPCEAAIGNCGYAEANAKQKDKLGHGLSQQAHSLRKKIIEVRNIVGRTYDGRVRESHPELCFYALNGQPIAYSKSSKRGLAFRRHLLEQENEGFRGVYEQVLNDTLRKDVRRDDILDSMVLALAAQSEDLRSVPENPEPDVPRIYYSATSTLADNPLSET